MTGDIYARYAKEFDGMEKEIEDLDVNDYSSLAEFLDAQQEIIDRWQVWFDAEIQKIQEGQA